MITVSEVIKRVRFLIAEDDAGNSFFTDTQIIESINYQLDRFAIDLEIPNAEYSFNTSVKVQEYNLPASVLSVYQVYYIENNRMNELRQVEFEDLIKEGVDISITGTPIVFYLKRAIIGDDYSFRIGLYPIPDKVLPVKMDVLNAIRTVSSPTDRLPFPRRYNILLSYLVLSDLYERDKRYNEAQYNLNKYKDEILQERARERHKIPEYVD